MILQLEEGSPGVALFTLWVFGFPSRIDSKRYLYFHFD